ncbi:MAG: hypothetical protein ACQER7_12320 [Bacteroidota bacterium]
MNTRKNVLNKLKVVFVLFVFLVNPSLAQDINSIFTLGGAIRYNIASENYESDYKATDTYFTWDTWRINVDGSFEKIDLSFEYRFYPTFGAHFIRYGYFGYPLSDNIKMKLGATQVPFGIMTYASHSWWFQGPYYVGLEDDYDMGISFEVNPDKKLKLFFSYFRQAEPEGPIFSGDVTFGNAGAGRYSYDVTSHTYQSLAGNNVNIRELNQLNTRATYSVKENCEIGFSAQVGGIYNSELEKAETSTAFAGHFVGEFNNFSLKTEYIKYHYQGKDNAGNDLKLIQMGAYGFNYLVASEASLYVMGVSYTIPVDWEPISSIQAYFDYTLTDKSHPDFYNTHQLVPGVLIRSGGLYTYIDYAMGKNHPWLTDDFGKGLGQGVKNPDWLRRFNINIGYYF